MHRTWIVAATVACLSPSIDSRAAEPESLTIEWKENYLTIRGPHLPGDEMRIHYLEAYCRPGSTDRDWKETAIGHKTELVEASPDRRKIRLRCTLTDGVIVDHEITALADEIDFRLVARNPTDQASLADWAQPCIRVDRFTGGDRQSYIEKCFVFYDGALARMPTRDWATEARYVPGQVWAAPGVDRDDVNPRPLNDTVPSSGLIGCFSADDSMIMATAFEPYQELFQGVIVCVHSDFRIGGLQPGESKPIRGKLYLVENDLERLLARYRKDFPEQQAR